MDCVVPGVSLNTLDNGLRYCNSDSCITIKYFPILQLFSFQHVSCKYFIVTLYVIDLTYYHLKWYAELRLFSIIFISSYSENV